MQNTKNKTYSAEFKAAAVKQAKKSVFAYIEVFYSRQQLYSKNGYVSPVGFESRLTVAVFVSKKVLTHQII